MRSRLIALAATLLAGLSPQLATADTALLLVNDRYSNAQNLRQGRDVEQLQASLRDAGFDVIVVSDGDGAQMRQGLQRLLQSGEDERLLIAAVGHFARSADDSWLLGVEADRPDLATIGGDGLSLSVLMEVAATAPGRAIVLLGQERRRIDLGPGLGVGVGRVDPPQGVTVLAGAPADLADFTLTGLLVPGTDLPAAVTAARSLRAFGFLSPDLAFLPAATPATGPDQPDVLPPGPQPPGADETALWEAAVELNTAAAYRAYIARYPAGFYAAEARQRVNSIENDPEALARAAEEALNLTREQRQQIQRSLSILDYDTRGIDGIFGPGTRGSIRGWQENNNLAVTGYLDGPQITELGRQAAIRAAELEQEAREAREARDRADRAYWQVTGQGATQEGLHAYLDRYPDGIFAERAEARLAEIERAARAEAEARDRAAWDVARAADSPEAYRSYLEDNPHGAFREQAQRRLDQLLAGVPLTPQEITEYQAREAALNLPAVTRSLVEQRLAALGLEPGPVDGWFDSRTRRAIRRYQQARGMDITGYLDQQTLVRLLAEAVGGILQIDGIINR